MPLERARLPSSQQIPGTWCYTTLAIPGRLCLTKHQTGAGCSGRRFTLFRKDGGPLPGQVRSPQCLGNASTNECFWCPVSGNENDTIGICHASSLHESRAPTWAPYGKPLLLPGVLCLPVGYLGGAPTFHQAAYSALRSTNN